MRAAWCIPLSDLGLTRSSFSFKSQLKSPFFLKQVSWLATHCRVLFISYHHTQAFLVFISFTCHLILSYLSIYLLSLEGGTLSVLLKAENLVQKTTTQENMIQTHTGTLGKCLLKKGRKRLGPGSHITWFSLQPWSWEVSDLCQVHKVMGLAYLSYR